MANFSLLDPYFLLLLPLFFLYKKKFSPIPIFFPNIKFINNNIKGKRKAGRSKFILPLLSWLFLVIALSNPILLNKKINIEQKNSNISLLLDVSGSMSALDFSTKDKIKTRLDVAKNSLSNFIKNRKSDNLSLIIFGDYAYLDSPFTTDNESLLANLHNITVGIAGDRTAIGDAITLAVSKLKDKKEGSKAIILLTDGENTAGTIEPLQAANLAKKYNIPIYTIGVGKNGDAPFISESGQVFYARVALDIHTLTQVANVTGGSFYRAENTEELKTIYKKLDNLIKVKNKKNIILQYKYLYRYFVFCALLSIFCYFYLGYRRVLNS